MKEKLFDDVEIDTEKIKEMLQQPFDAEKMVDEAMQNRICI